MGISFSQRQVLSFRPERRATQNDDKALLRLNKNPLRSDHNRLLGHLITLNRLEQPVKQLDFGEAETPEAHLLPAERFGEQACF